MSWHGSARPPLPAGSRRPDEAGPARSRSPLRWSSSYRRLPPGGDLDLLRGGDRDRFRFQSPDGIDGSREGSHRRKRLWKIKRGVCPTSEAFYAHVRIVSRQLLGCPPPAKVTQKAKTTVGRFAVTRESRGGRTARC